MKKAIAALTVAVAVGVPAGAVAQAGGGEGPCGPFQVQFVTRADAVARLESYVDLFTIPEGGAGYLQNIHTHRISPSAFRGRADIDGYRQFIRLRWQAWSSTSSTGCTLVVEATIVAIKNRHVAFDPPVGYPRAAGA